MSKFKVNMTYEPFSKEQEYIQVNRDFIQGLNINSCERMLDLACGTGTMTDLILRNHPEIPVVLGVDISRGSLSIAQAHFNADEGKLSPHDVVPKHVHNCKLCSSINLVEASADIIPLRDRSVDLVIMGNSIHLLSDEEKLISEVRRVLRPGCIFAFNSSFYAGTMPKGTEGFNHEWVKQALLYLMRKDGELRKKGLKGIPRKRSTTHRAFSKKWLSMDDWARLLNRRGFQVKSVCERTVMMNQRCFETIGAYAGFASTIFSGYPVHLASEALQETAGLALSVMQMDKVPRLWLEVSAVRK